MEKYFIKFLHTREMEVMNDNYHMRYFYLINDEHSTMDTSEERIIDIIIEPLVISSWVENVHNDKDRENVMFEYARRRVITNTKNAVFPIKDEIHITIKDYKIVPYPFRNINLPGFNNDITMVER